ncbi:MAG: hypothetical protein AAB250_11920 [Bdellovibrionota bacterium]
MFHQANQRFGTLDLIMLVVLCGTVSSVVGASIAGFTKDTRPTRARSSAEALALQIRAQHENALASMPPAGGGDRAPASVEVPPLTDGQIGRDPWGRQFHYSVLGPLTDLRPAIAVWSGGANGKVDSDVSEFDEAAPEKFHFRGDDVGFLSLAATKK